MRILVCAMIVMAVAAPAVAERRCGWYNNPTPANVILADADGQWWILRQGSAPAPGFEDAYDNAFDDRVRFDSRGRIITGGPGYGYSCACVDGVFDANAPLYENVLSVSRFTELPVARCEADPKLSAKPDY